MATKTNKNKTTQNKSKPVASKNSTPVKGGKTAHVHREKGAVLDTVYVLIMIHSLIAIYLGYTQLKPSYTNSATWIVPLLAIASVLSLVGAIGMWNWKKWGLYLYVASQLLQIVAHLVMTGSIWVIFYDAFPLLVLGYIFSMQNKLRFFE